MRYLYIVVFLILTCSIFYTCSEKNKLPSSDGFKIDGIAKNANDSSWVYLEAADNKILDSSIVINGKFTLRGKVNGPTNSVLHLKYNNNFLEYKYFWVENKKIKFEAEKGKFMDAKISGSATQVEDDVLFGAYLPLRKQEDSLRTLLQRTGNKNVAAELREQLKKIDQQEKNIYINFIENHPASLVSVFTLNIYKRTWGKDKTSELFDKLTVQMKLSKYGQQIEKYIKINVNPRIGDNYVDFELPNVAGKPVKLSEIKGKVILLDFWAAWCGPCREENKQLVKTYSEFHPKGFEIFGVSGDNNSKNWLDAIHDDKLAWENVCDLKGDESDPFLIYGIYSIPDNFLIDKNGKIIGRNLRGDNLRKKLKEVLD